MIKISKRMCALFLALIMVFSLAACSKKQSEADKIAATDGTKGVVTVWTKDDTIGYYDNFLKEKYPNLKVNLVVMDDDTMKTKLKAVLSSGATPPDVVLIEIGMWKEMMNLPMWQDLSAAPFNGSALLAEQYDYTQGLSKNKAGQIVGFSNQATPAGYYYRRSVAKTAFGTDDPAEIAAKLVDWPSVMQAGQEVYEKAGVPLFPCLDDIVRITSNTSPEPWIKDNKFVINENVLKAFDLAKEADEKHVAGRLEMWGPEWSDNLNTAKDSMGLFIATWLMPYNIKMNAPDTKGDWGLAQIVGPQFFGGSFFAMPAKAENKAQAWEYIKTVTCDHDFLSFFSNDIGDFCSNKVVNEELAKTNSADEWWGGQNALQTFSDIAAGANPESMYDFQGDAIGAVTDAVKNYVYQGITLDEAINQIKETFAADVPSVEVVTE